MIHRASHNPWARARNSASALDLETTFCFLLRHVMRLPPRESEVDTYGEGWDEEVVGEG